MQVNNNWKWVQRHLLHQNSFWPHLPEMGPGLTTQQFLQWWPIPNAETWTARFVSSIQVYWSKNQTEVSMHYVSNFKHKGSYHKCSRFILLTHRKLLQKPWQQGWRSVVFYCGSQQKMGTLCCPRCFGKLRDPWLIRVLSKSKHFQNRQQFLFLQPLFLKLLIWE